MNFLYLLAAAFLAVWAVGIEFYSLSLAEGQIGSWTRVILQTIAVVMMSGAFLIVDAAH